MFGVNGGIFAPVRRAWSGTMRRPVLHELGVTDGEAFFPNATTPPINVTLAEVTIFAGSDRPELTTALILVDRAPGVALLVGGGAPRGGL